MITFDQGSRRFNYRVVAVCVDGGHVLLHKAVRDDFWALPGGRGELLESSVDALKREMREELEVEVTVDRLLWVVENFFRYDGTDYHELALYHQVSLPPGSKYLAKEQTFEGIEENSLRLIFRWFPRDDLAHVRLFPSFLRESLKHLPASPQHVVHWDVDV